jgi:hypothetical protein
MESRSAHARSVERGVHLPLMAAIRSPVDIRDHVVASDENE